MERLRWRIASARARGLLWWESGWGEPRRPELGGRKAAGAACAEPTLPSGSTPSCSGAAKYANRVASCAGFAFLLKSGAGVFWLGHTSWSATFLEISAYIDKF